LARTVGDAPRLSYHRGEVIYAQGAPADSVFYIHKGGVKLSVVSAHGKEGVVAVLKSRQFAGEGCMVGQTERLRTATAITTCSVSRIEKPTMLRVLKEQPALASQFISFLIDQNSQYEDDLLSHLFHSSERRLLRVLVHLSNVDKKAGSHATLPKISQETLAAMVGTTRGRINAFMSKFRRLGLVRYDGDILVDQALLSSALGEEGECQAPAAQFQADEV
jgi:CRP/FNR family transcriptional regulator, cyclic AMP receptor protein